MDTASQHDQGGPGTRLNAIVFEKKRHPILGALGLIAALAANFSP
jgi:hypothetical protein